MSKSGGGGGRGGGESVDLFSLAAYGEIDSLKAAIANLATAAGGGGGGGGSVRDRVRAIVNARDSYGLTAMHEAARAGHLHVCISTTGSLHCRSRSLAHTSRSFVLFRFYNS